MKKTCGNCGLCGSGSCCYFTAKNCTAWRHDGIPSRAAIRELVRAVEWLMNEFNEIPSPSKSYGAWNHINQSVKKVKRQMKRKK